MYRSHIQSAQDASELGELVARVLRSRQLERAVAIGVQATRSLIALQIFAEVFQITSRGPHLEPATTA